MARKELHEQLLQDTPGMLMASSELIGYTRPEDIPGHLEFFVDAKNIGVANPWAIDAELALERPWWFPSRPGTLGPRQNHSPTRQEEGDERVWGRKTFVTATET